MYMYISLGGLCRHTHRTHSYVHIYVYLEGLLSLFDASQQRKLLTVAHVVIILRELPWSTHMLTLLYSYARMYTLKDFYRCLTFPSKENCTQWHA